MSDEIETRPQPKFALLSLDEYVALNCAYSLEKGYAVGQKTERCFEIYPSVAKTNIVYDQDGNEVSFDTDKVIVPISSHIQEFYPDLISGFTLVDSFEHVDQSITEFDLLTEDATVIGWLLQQVDRVGGNNEQITLNVSQALLDMLPDQALENMNAKGLNIQKKA